MAGGFFSTKGGSNTAIAEVNGVKISHRSSRRLLPRWCWWFCRPWRLGRLCRWLFQCWSFFSILISNPIISLKFSLSPTGFNIVIVSVLLNPFHQFFISVGKYKNSPINILNPKPIAVCLYNVVKARNRDENIVICSENRPVIIPLFEKAGYVRYPDHETGMPMFRNS